MSTAAASHQTASLAGLAQRHPLQWLTQWQSAIEGMAAAMEPLHQAVGLDADAPVSKALTEFEIAITEATACVTGLSFELLCWHWIENDWGRAGGFPLFIQARSTPGQAIRTLDDLLKLGGATSKATWAEGGAA